MQEKTPAESESLLGPGEVARRLGVSIKALRVYERAGPVKPRRREGGWRAYGPQHIARLHQVLVLKDLGLSLQQVREVIGAAGATLDQTLALQSRQIRTQLALQQERLETIARARRKLRDTGSLSLDDLLTLAREASTHRAPSSGELDVILAALAEGRELTSEIADLRSAIAGPLKDAGLKLAELQQHVADLVAEASRLAPDGDPTSEAAARLAARWLSVAAHVADPQARADPFDAFGAGLRRLAGDAYDNPDLHPALEFLQKAVAARSGLHAARARCREH